MLNYSSHYYEEEVIQCLHSTIAECTVNKRRNWKNRICTIKPQMSCVITTTWNTMQDYSGYHTAFAHVSSYDHLAIPSVGFLSRSHRLRPCLRLRLLSHAIGRLTWINHTTASNVIDHDRSSAVSTRPSHLGHASICTRALLGFPC